MMRHLSFAEHQMARSGNKIPLWIRLHHLFCKTCREECKTQEWNFISEIQRHYCHEEKKQIISPHDKD